jgi:hypothetical protein
MRPGTRNQRGEVVVHRRDGLVRHPTVRIRDELSGDVDDSRADIAGADVREQEIFVRKLARQHLPAGALVCGRCLPGGDLETRRNVVGVKVDHSNIMGHRFGSGLLRASGKRRSSGHAADGCGAREHSKTMDQRSTFSFAAHGGCLAARAAAALANASMSFSSSPETR